MDNTVLSTILWVAAAGILTLLVSRRRKRKYAAK